jgi:hypothetical protein
VREAPFKTLYEEWIGVDDDRQYMSLVTIMVPKITSTGLQSLFAASKEYQKALKDISPDGAVHGSLHSLVSNTGMVNSESINPSNESSYSLREQMFSLILSATAKGSAKGGATGMQENRDAWLKAVAAAMKIRTKFLAELGNRVYVNSPLREKDLPNWREAYYGASASRLIEIDQKYDPMDCMSSPEDMGYVPIWISFWYLAGAAGVCVVIIGLMSYLVGGRLLTRRKKAEEGSYLSLVENTGRVS